jgi:hypothetical protein
MGFKNISRRRSSLSLSCPCLKPGASRSFFGETGQTEVNPYLGEYEEEFYPIGIQIKELEGNRQKSQ